MKNFLFIAAIAASVLSSCNNEDVPLNKEVSTAGNVLTVNTDIIATKSPISSFPNGAELGLFVTTGIIGDNYNGVESNNNVKSTYNGSIWAQTPSVYLSQANATIFALYPYASAKVTASAIPVEHTTQTDYMYGTHTTGQAAINNGNATVNLTMVHALSMVQFNFSKKNYTGAGKLTKIEIANGNGSFLSSTGTLNLSSGIITNLKEYSSAVIESVSGLIVSIPSAPSVDESTYPKVLTLPVTTATLDGNIVIKFTIDGKIYNWNVPAATKWEKSTKNTYAVTIEGTEIKVGNVTITDWVGGASGNADIK